MSRILDAKERQECLDKEHANIGKFSGFLSASCKYVWAGSLAIFFSIFIGAAPELVVKFRSVFNFLWAAAFFGALSFLFEFLQYGLAYWHARNFVSWMGTADQVSDDDVRVKLNSWQRQANDILFFLKLICSLLSAIFLVIGIAIVVFRQGDMAN